MDAYDPRGIDVALMSRFPLDSVHSHIGEYFTGDSGERYRFSRDALEIDFHVDETRYVVFVAHLRSQIGDGDDKRHAAAGYIASLVEARRAAGAENIIVLGDMNDTPESQTVREFEAASLRNVTSKVADQHEWSYHWDGENILLDYVFADQHLYEHAFVRLEHDPLFQPASDHAPLRVDFY